VHELIQGKHRDSSQPTREELRKGFRGWHERGYLPHRDEPGLIQFVTFNLADCFPAALRAEWKHLWKIEDRIDRREQLEGYMDKGLGECHLRRTEIAQLVEDSLRNYSDPAGAPEPRYELRAWVIMPNHIHALFRTGSVPMSTIVDLWKGRTSRLANGLLGRTGEFWHADYFDTFMRDSVHERRTIRYIENNPVKAKLARSAKDWPWSSARFRDEYGNLDWDIAGG
jgi:REP element-mobilizing transposase RayT